MCCIFLYDKDLCNSKVSEKINYRPVGMTALVMLDLMGPNGLSVVESVSSRMRRAGGGHWTAKIAIGNRN